MNIMVLIICLQNSKILSVHCVAHRLALAVAAAAKGHMAVNFCLKKLDDIKSYYSKSSTRTSGFRAVQVINTSMKCNGNVLDMAA